ncbi:MAG: M28 family peptidase [Balneolaceae bacterium]
MKKLSIILFLSVFVFSCLSTEQLQEKRYQELLSYSETITPELLRNHLEIIAHDSLDGREAGTVGERKTAQYLIDHYEKLGISPKGTEGYLQPFIMNAERVDSLVYRTYNYDNDDMTEINYSSESKTGISDFIRLFGGSEPQSGDVIFGGFGVDDPSRDVEHLDDVAMKDKWVLIFDDIPHVVDGDTLINPAISNNQRAANLLSRIQAKGVLVISDLSSDEFETMSSENSEMLEQPENMRLQYMDDSDQGGFPRAYTLISPEMAATFLDLNSTNDLQQYREELISNITTFEPHLTNHFVDYTPYGGTVEIESNNVLAFIEGNDPELKDEVVVLMGHYDHIGITEPDETGDSINNGADDNGSGTSALLSIAESLQKAADNGRKLDRSVLFLHVSAEEKGLLGSRYYSDHPVIPIDQTVTAFNTDMVGRSDPQNLENGDTDYVYLIGGEIISSELDSLVQSANNQSVNMRLDRHYNDLTDSNQFYRRSDHWNFGRLDVPFVFFFTGVHDDYHAPGDEVDKIDFEKLSRISRLIYTSTIQVANYDGRPEVDNEEFIRITRDQPR